MTLNQPLQQLQQELQMELTTANQLLRLILMELQQIKDITNPGGQFEANIQKNASLLETLASIQNADIENLPPLTRSTVNMDSNGLSEQNELLRDRSNLLVHSS